MPFCLSQNLSLGPKICNISKNKNRFRCRGVVKVVFGLPALHEKHLFWCFSCSVGVHITSFTTPLQRKRSVFYFLDTSPAGSSVLPNSSFRRVSNVELICKLSLPCSMRVQQLIVRDFLENSMFWGFRKLHPR